MNSKYIKLIKEGINVEPLQTALIENPHLWNTITARTENEESPHYQLDDIWVRAADPLDLHLAEKDLPFRSIWYDVAYELPIFDLAKEVLSFYPGDLGGVLITRIKAGKLCKPHKDIAWHARYYDKIAVSIQANDKQAFCFDDGFLVTKPGDAFWFYNNVTHWVPNISNEDRITAIFAIKPTENNMNNTKEGASGEFQMSI